MTKQESFKRRVRARMAETGERYGAARRVLIEQASDARRWEADPEMTDEAVREATGRGWDEWCDLVDAGPGRDAGHTAIAAWLRDEHDVPGWWAQAVTVGYERIAGLRLPHQRADGTFEANRSRTVPVDASELRSLLLDDEDRVDLLPGLGAELRSKPTTKTLRFRVDDTVFLVDLAARDDGRTTVTVSHQKLRSADEVARWKDHWGRWLDALAEG